jgi:glucose-6-phosphate 1-dehydrogenase
MERPENCIIVIFGASGDLTNRKLIPSLFNLFERNLMPERFSILGSGRQPISDDEFRNKMRQSIELNAKDAETSDQKVEDFLNKIYYQSLDYTNHNAYQALHKRLLEVDEEYECCGNYLFYLSVPPFLFDDITTGLAQMGLNEESAGWRRVIVEKPFGYDLDSAKKLNKELHKHFDENQIYRIDHYLGKETVQNLLVFRFANGIFEPLWNNKYIDRVEITSAEDIGVGKRGGYYDSSGALRDMFQNHLLQVVGMVAMEPPAKFNDISVRNETLKVFQSFRNIAKEDVPKYVVRGQYTESVIRGKKVPCYRDEEGVPKDSRTETYIAVKFFIDNWRWAGVPFYVRTGKRLPTRVTEVVIHYKKIAHKLFNSTSSGYSACNQLVIRIQPDEGILLKFNMKLPGSGFDVKTVNMDFHYADLANSYVPQAYERLLLDCMLGDATLFARSDAVEACWAFVEPILQAWNENLDIPVYGYPAGTWGPQAARKLFEDPELDWRYPCRNLVDDGEYCEL